MPAPSPRSRGEGWGEGSLKNLRIAKPLTRLASLADLSPQTGRGEVVFALPKGKEK